jgi:hypothetical protein
MMSTTVAPAVALPNLVDYQPAASGAPHEEVLIRYTKGTGRFSHDKRFISLVMTMADPYGRPDGRHEGVWERMFSDPRELLRVPENPQRSFITPEGPIEALPLSAQTKGIWVFGDGSSITAVGPAMSSLTPLEDGSWLFMVATAQWITNGTGKYAGASGLKSSLGSTHIPAGVDLFGPEPVDFEATTIDTFRVMRRQVQQQN